MTASAPSRNRGGWWRLRWGAAWDIDFTASQDSPEDIVSDYGARRRAEGKKAFLDGPHYELPRAKYP